MAIKSLYDISNKFGERTLNTGFDYKSDGILLKKSLSPYMYRNAVLSEFLDEINDILVNNIEATKNIRIHNNFTVDKNTKYIN